ncbi:MAG TPA: hypothetical protein VEZ72_24880 [Paenibacillus sp.]|nr:hypothetical protein [Paenibacillus sp.]
MFSTKAMPMPIDKPAARAAASGGMAGEGTAMPPSSSCRANDVPTIARSVDAVKRAPSARYESSRNGAFAATNQKPQGSGVE